jgi:hypothetical protein
MLPEYANVRPNDGNQDVGIAPMVTSQPQPNIKFSASHDFVVGIDTLPDAVVVVVVVVPGADVGVVTGGVVGVVTGGADTSGSVSTSLGASC